MSRSYHLALLQPYQQRPDLGVVINRAHHAGPRRTLVSMCRREYTAGRIRYKLNRLNASPTAMTPVRALEISVFV